MKVNYIKFSACNISVTIGSIDFSGILIYNKFIKKRGEPT